MKMDKAQTAVLVLGTVAVVVMTAWWLMHVNGVDLSFLTPAFVRDHIQAYGHWAILVYIAVYVFNTILIFPPNTPITLAAGLIFGAFWGGVWIMVSAVIGTSLAFFISRSLGRKSMEPLIQGRWEDVNERLGRNGFLAVLLLRLIPVLPFEILNYLCGLSKIAYWDFIAGTFLGLLPGAFLTAFIGGELGTVARWNDLLTPRIITAAVLAGAVVGVTLLITVIKRKSLWK